MVSFQQSSLSGNRKGKKNLSCIQHLSISVFFVHQTWLIFSFNTCVKLPRVSQQFCGGYFKIILEKRFSRIKSAL